MLGVLAGGAIAQHFGYVPMYAVATVLSLVATLCAWRVLRLEAAQQREAAG